MCLLTTIKHTWMKTGNNNKHSISTTKFTWKRFSNRLKPMIIEFRWWCSRQYLKHQSTCIRHLYYFYNTVCCSHDTQPPQFRFWCGTCRFCINLTITRYSGFQPWGHESIADNCPWTVFEHSQSLQSLNSLPVQCPWELKQTREDYSDTLYFLLCTLTIMFWSWFKILEWERSDTAKMMRRPLEFTSVQLFE